MDAVNKNNFWNLKILRAQSSSGNAARFTEYRRPPLLSRSCDSKIFERCEYASRIVLVDEVIFIKAKGTRMTQITRIRTDLMLLCDLCHLHSSPIKLT